MQKCKNPIHKIANAYDRDILEKQARHRRGIARLLLAHSKIESTARDVGIEVDDAIEIAEKIDIQVIPWAEHGASAYSEPSHKHFCRAIRHRGPQTAESGRDRDQLGLARLNTARDRNWDLPAERFTGPTFVAN